MIMNLKYMKLVDDVNVRTVVRKNEMQTRWRISKMILRMESRQEEIVDG